MKREKERGSCSGKANSESCVMFKYESVSVEKLLQKTVTVWRFAYQISFIATSNSLQLFLPKGENNVFNIFNSSLSQNYSVKERKVADAALLTLLIQIYEMSPLNKQHILIFTTFYSWLTLYKKLILSIIEL